MELLPKNGVSEARLAHPQDQEDSRLSELEHLYIAAEQKRDQCKKQGWTFEFNGRHIILRDLTEKIISWIVKFKEIGDIAINFDPVHAALPWAGVRFLLQVAVAESEQMGALLIGIEKVASINNRCKVYETLYLQPKQTGQAVENLKLALEALYVLVLQFLCSANRSYTSSAVRILNGVLNRGHVVDFIKNCEALENRVDIEVSNCQRTIFHSDQREINDRVQKLKKILEEFQGPALRTDSRVAALYMSLTESEKCEILTWISSIPYEMIHQIAREGRTDGTGEWLLKDRRFHVWRRRSSSTILWLHGIPGSGKTKLTSKVVDYLINERYEHPNDEALVYFYCDRNKADRRDPTLILNSFIRQLSAPRDGETIQKSTADVYHRKKASGFASGPLDFEESRAILLQLVSSFPQVTIVVDALDECDKRSRKQLIDTLDYLVDRSPNVVKLFISSREDGDIKYRFRKGPNVAIRAIDNRGDTVKFVVARIDDSPPHWNSRIGHSQREYICDTLVQKSGGMFQWVSLQIDQLLELLPRESDIRQRLGKLPEDLNQTYDEIYARIKAQDGSASKIADRAFQWVMYSGSPLSPELLAVAVCQDPETDGIDPVDIEVNYILAACHNLLVIDEELGVCRLSHLSVQEYFETRHWDHRKGHGFMARLYLSMLNDPAKKYQDVPIEAGVFGDKTVSNSINRLLWYARFRWPTNVQQHGADNLNERVSVSLMKFLGSMNEGSSAYKR